MTIIVKGTLPAPKKDIPWWVNRIVHCPHCGGSFRLDANDSVAVLAATDKVARHAEVICPTKGCFCICWVSP